jgi:DNA adenine methylase
MGSACLFYAIQPSSALLSDINHDLVETFIAVRDHPRAVYNALSRIPLGRDSYYQVRKLDPSSINLPNRASRFIFLNRFAFNGLYRTNLKGEFNVPYSHSRTGDLPTWSELYAASKALKNAGIYCSDFEKSLKATKKGDFVYLDPPYALLGRRVFRQYGPGSFELEDLERLSESLRTMNKRGVKFVLSYAYCKEAIGAFGEWNTRKILVQRNISGFSKHRRRAAELLISNIPLGNSM